MTSNASKELKLAYGIAIVLLIVGVLSYTAFSAKAPDEPLRIVFTGAGGASCSIIPPMPRVMTSPVRPATIIPRSPKKVQP